MYFGPDELVNGDTPCWTGDEEYDDYEGNGVLPRTGSDEPVDSVVRTTGSDEPVDSVIHTPGPDEPVNGDTPCWTGDEEYVDNEGNVVLPRTGSNELVDSVVRTTRSDEPMLRNVLPCPGLGLVSQSMVLLVHLGQMTRMALVLRMVKFIKALLPP